MKVWDLSYIPKNFENIKPLDFSKQMKRNPFRPLPLTEHTLDRAQGDNEGKNDIGNEREIPVELIN